MKNLVCILIVLLAGCSPPPNLPKEYPPCFLLGDLVTPNNSKKIGIVTHRQKKYNQTYWRYSVMFQETTMDYAENQLRFIEHFDWTRTEPLPLENAYPTQKPKGEIESGDEIP